MSRTFTHRVSLIMLFCMGFLIYPTNISAQNCDKPTGLNVTNISNFSATLNWALDTNVDHYRLRYKEAGSSSWLFVFNPIGGSHDISNLVSTATYIWQARAFCSPGSSPSSNWSIAWHQLLPPQE